MIAKKDRDGSTVFPGSHLGCDLGTTCADAFDETLARAVPSRSTGAAELLGFGVERDVALGKRSTITLQTNRGQYQAELSGKLGYSECSDGSDPCPFYLGSFEAASSSRVTVRATCKDGGLGRILLDNLVVALSQPAFGIQDGLEDVGFPAGALVVDTAFDVGRSFHARVLGRASDPRVCSSVGPQRRLRPRALTRERDLPRRDLAAPRRLTGRASFDREIRDDAE